ncbi:MAG: VPLPA-CTERM sorting domain-containing protein [Gammaproteobacteria bacterium]|nr:VPLPA-CTERM sorting domain-containing protein [Gammaproteobacteria bacterium]
MRNIIKGIIGLALTGFLSQANAAIVYPAMNINSSYGGTGITSTSTEFVIDSTVINILTDGLGAFTEIVDQSFNLVSDTSGTGTITIGNTGGLVINGSFTNLTLSNLGRGAGEFYADITFTGITYGGDSTDWSEGMGFLSDNLVSGRLEGGFVVTDRRATIAFGNTFSTTSSYAELGSLEVTAVPVPAAVWLFGTGLLGLVAVARRKSV